MTDSEKLDLLLAEVTGVKNETKELRQEVAGIKNETKELKQKVDNIENKLTDVKLTLENEIRENIRCVAEGHLDLSRNLHEALKHDTEKEMLAVRVNVLESEVRNIKSHLDIA